MPFTIVTEGRFTCAGVAVKIPLPSSADYFRTVNITQMAATQTPGRCVSGEWFKDAFSDNNGLRWTKTNATNAINIDTFATATASDGFTYVRTAPVTEAQAAAAITSITQAGNAVVTQVNTYSNGDILRIYNTTGMLQIAGMTFQISSVSAAGYTLIGLNSSGFAFPATAGNTRRVSVFEAVDPQFLYVTGISQATQAVVTTSVDPTRYYVVGMLVRFSIPSGFGMIEMDGLTGKIVALNAANYTMTVDIDSSAFSTFAFPTSANILTQRSFATLAPAGVRTQFNPITNVQTGYDFQFQPFHTGEFTPFMLLGAGAQSPAGSLNDVIYWQALAAETGLISPTNP